MITSIEMQNLEKSSGIPVIDLMENAGKAIATKINEKYDLKNKKILIVCYHGNNGGEGFVAARHLCEHSEVDVLFLGNEEKLKKEALINYKKISENNKIQFVNYDIDYNTYEVIIDSIFGTGLDKKVKDPIYAVINNINESKAKKVSVDVPSGLNPDTGEEANISVLPDLILALHDIKKGIENQKDKTIILDIGLKS